MIAWKKGDKQIIYANSEWNVMIFVFLLDVACQRHSALPPYATCLIINMYEVLLKANKGKSLCLFVWSIYGHISKYLRQNNTI